MKISNNITNNNQYKCLQKISEIVDKTQIKKKQFKYLININHQADDKIKKDLEKSLDKKDVLIKNPASQVEATNNCVIQFKKKGFLLALYKLFNARNAEWERNLKVIDHLLRIESKNNDVELTFKIMKILEKFRNICNSNLMKIHIERYCSFNTNF
ncbi:hypothetical protein ACTFIY_006043 [Dictyostelium cf. discoideum]